MPGKTRKATRPRVGALLKDMKIELEKTADAMGRAEAVPEQLQIVGRRLGGLENRLRRLDAQASADWTNDVADTSNRLARSLGRVDKSEPNADLVEVDRLVTALESLSALLGDGASSLSFACGLAGKDADVAQAQEIRKSARPVQRAMAELSFDLYRSAFEIRATAGLAAAEGSGFRVPGTGCGCGCAGLPREDNPLLPIGDSESDVPGSETERLLRRLRRLREVLTLLAQLLAGLVALAASNAGGPPCDDECTPSNSVVGTTIININAVAAGLGAFQPVCDVQWDFCCTNRCFIFYKENFIKSVQTGPHNLGGTVNGKAAALAIAATRAAALRPITALPIPAKPTC